MEPLHTIVYVCVTMSPGSYSGTVSTTVFATDDEYTGQIPRRIAQRWHHSYQLGASVPSVLCPMSPGSSRSVSYSISGNENLILAVYYHHFSSYHTI